jgi:hypothetical protein
MKTIIFYHPTEKKWKNWKSGISGTLKFKSNEEALKEFKKQQSVKNGTINKFKVIDIN